MSNASGNGNSSPYYVLDGLFAPRSDLHAVFPASDESAAPQKTDRVPLVEEVMETQAGAVYTGRFSLDLSPIAGRVPTDGFLDVGVYQSMPSGAIRCRAIARIENRGGEIQIYWVN